MLHDLSNIKINIQHELLLTLYEFIIIITAESKQGTIMIKYLPGGIWILAPSQKRSKQVLRSVAEQKQVSDGNMLYIVRRITTNLS